MAITYPITGLVDGTIIQSQTPPKITWRQEMSRTAAGQSIGKDLGPAVWEFTWTTKPLLRQAALEYEARLHSLRGLIGTFLGGDLRRLNPASDPQGTALTGHSVQIAAFTANTVSFKNLPSSFVLTTGDYFTLTYGSGKRSYHRLLESGTASGGISPSLAFQPEFRPGTAAVNGTIVLKGAMALCRLKPDSIDLQEIDQLHSSISFSAVEA